MVMGVRWRPRKKKCSNPRSKIVKVPSTKWTTDDVVGGVVGGWVV
jgi:hypothetical protein